MFAFFRNWFRNEGRKRRPFRLTARQAAARNSYRPLLEKLEDRLTPSASLNDSFIAVLYQGFLGRTVESGGLTYWNSRLNSGSSYSQVAQGILSSLEYDARQIQSIYQSRLGHAADNSGLNFWTHLEQAGTPSDKVKAGILGSSEFYALAGGTLDGFVRTLYKNELRRDLDSVGASYFGTQVLTGTSRESVALEILRSKEAQQLQVGDLYRTDLGRAADSAGTAYWVGVMQSGQTAESVSANMLGAKEFLNLLKSYATNSPLTDPNAVAQKFMLTYGLFGNSQTTPPQNPTSGPSSIISSVVVQAPDFVTRERPLLQIQVSASDFSQVDPTVHIDVDLNHNGTFTDAGEQDYAIGYSIGGSTTLTIPNNFTRGVYSIRARVRDIQGHEVTSAVVSMQVDPNEGFIGSQALLDLAYGLPYGSTQNVSSGFGAPGYPGNPGGSGENPAPKSKNSIFVFDAQGRVLVSVRSTLGKYLDGLTADLKNIGMVVGFTTPAQNMVTGFLPVNQILNMPNLAHFAAANAIIKPVYRTGEVDSQGDQILLAQQFRASQNVDGTGQKIGILSDSVNQAMGPGNGTGIAASQATGDLPASSRIQVLKDGPSGSTDEGRAMMEITYDLAPGANFAFYSPDSPQDFAAGINALANAGSTVIVDDLGFSDSPMFNDGVIAQAVDGVANAGVFYASAAGNQANQGWQGDWKGTSTTVGDTTGTFQDFGGGNALQNFTLQTNSQLQVTLEWDSAYLEGGSPLPNFAVNNEIDAFIVNTSTNQIVARFTTNSQNTGEATQFITFTNDGTFGTNNFAFAFELANGSAPTKLRWANFNGADPMADGEGAPTTFGQPAAKGAVAVGAADWRTPAISEPFSAVGGPLTFLFDANGNRLSSPDIRNKPEVAATDGVWTTFFGQQLAGDAFPSFFGTSAAAPHVAAAAALLLQQAPGTTPAALTQHLEATALDIAAPGFDPTSGFGLIQLTPIQGGGGGGGGGGQQNFPDDPFDPNATSDTATNFGSITSGYQQSYTGLTINIQQGGLPNFDWYTWTPDTAGTFSATLTRDAGNGLEMHLWTVNGGYLTELGRTVVGANTDKGSISALFASKQPIYIEIKGINIAPGVTTTGQYELALSFS